MRLPLLRQLKRLLPFLALGISTTLLILGLRLNFTTAQQISMAQNPSPQKGVKESYLHEEVSFRVSHLEHTNLSFFNTPLLQRGRGDLIAQSSQPTSPTFNLVQQGKTAYQKGQLNQAINVWREAADTFAAQDDRLHQAMTLSYLAQAYQQSGIWNQANAAIALSLQLLKQSNQGATSDRFRILAEAQTIQGSLQLDQGQSSEAYTSWQQAMNAFQQAGDRAGVVRSQLNQSQALLTLGLYKRANKLLASLYAKRPPEELLQLGILLNYGETLRLVGPLQDDPLAKSKTQSSEAVLQQGLALAQKLKTPADITKAQISLGNTYRALYQQQKRLQANPCPVQQVLAYHQNALRSYQAAADGTDSPTSKIQALLNQQSLLLVPRLNTEPISTEQAAQALAIATQIQAQLDRLPLNRTALYTRIQLAYNLLKLDQMPLTSNASGVSNQAAQLLKTASEQAETLGDQPAQSYALGYLGQAYEQQQQENDALKATTQALTLKALNIAKTINAPEIAYRWFWQLGRLDRANNPERAVKNYNAAYNTLQGLRADLPSDNAELQFSFQERPVEQAYREYADLLLQPDAVGTKALQKTPETPQEHLRTAREVMRSLQVTELQNFLQQPCAEASVQQLDRLVDESTSPTATLYPMIFRDRIEVIARLPKGELFSYRANIPEATVKATIAQFQQDVQESYTFDAVKEGGQTLYKWLIEPAQKQLESAQIKTLVFVLDGPLRNIPMSALYDGERYLIEKYAVSVSLGLDLSQPEKLPNDRLKVLAASLATPPAQFHNQFAKLDYVDKELETIQKTNNIAVTPLQDGNFTRRLFNKQLSNAQFDIVHLATHGQFSSNPQETFILTAPSRLPDGNYSDGKIRLNDFDEMFRTRIINRADVIELLILSACETASGDDRATLGIAGAAVKAGARSAIASLWSLDDESSQTLIATFYKSITQPQTSRAEALRQAQLALLQEQDGAYNHPRYWAPFLLVGNWL